MACSICCYDKSEGDYDVVVVGAGLAGLQAAKSMSSLSPSLSVLMVEASSMAGGRIRHVEGLSPWPVEAGAEFLHGMEHSSIQTLAHNMGCVTRELPYPDRYFIGDMGHLLLGEEAENHPDIRFIHDLFSKLATEDLDGSDVSVSQYLREKGASLSQLHFAESIYANDFGCSLDKLGLVECIHEAKHWIFGDSYLLIDRPLSSFIHFLAQGLQVRCDWPVAKIEYKEGDSIKVENKSGKWLSAKKVILTVPLTVLKDGDICFNPPLPPQKVRAINSIGMLNAVKVIMSFSHKFWPRDLFDIVCSGCFLPEIWMTEYPISVSKESDLNNISKQPPLGRFVAVGFAAGDQATKICSLTDGEIFQEALSQLDRIFSQKVNSSTKHPHSNIESEDIVNRGLDANSRLFHDSNTLTNDCFDDCPASFKTKRMNNRTQNKYTQKPIEVMKDFRDLSIPSSTTREYLENLDPLKYPASSSFAGGCVFDWSKVPYIRGAYTHPTIGALGCREILSEPIDGKLYFAGEATHSGVNPCMQACLDTGERAAKEVVNSFSTSKL